MINLSKIFSRREEKQLLITPILGVMGGFLMLVILYGLKTTIPASEQRVSIAAGVVGILFLLFQYFVLVPWVDDHPPRQCALAALNGALISIWITFEPFASHTALIAVFVVTGVTAAAVLEGRRSAYLMVGVVFLSQILFAPPSRLGSDELFWLETASYPIIALTITESILILQRTIQAQVKRLKVLNNVAQSLASSLETHQVIALLSSAIQNALDADTYFVGLLTPDGTIRLDLFYDEGEFFPSMNIPLENTLAGWVLDHHAPLLMNDLEQDSPRLGIPYRVIGKQKSSKSWMGVPLETGGRMLGIVAVASYQTSAFSAGDLELLQNVARQASNAIDNAYHHAEVERQSTLDSLTGALNHGYFLQSLGREADTVRMSGGSLSLIMLDVDHFKLYNDRYGHLIGDQVLSLLTEIIREHVKKTDLVGRWGGEEFVIGLPNANGAQAFEIALRIQSSMNRLTLNDRDEQPIPAPSVSQGVAVFPYESDNIHTLIDLADQRLYIAKERGRNQIDPLRGHWEKKLLPKD